MATAKLSIDLEARLAGLQQGLDKAGLLAEREADRMAAAFKGAQQALAGITGAFGAQQILQAFNRVVTGLDALNDAADATGASIENLSALEDIAARNGTAFDTVTDAVVKFNKALGDKDAAAIFKGIGLSVADLKKLDPAEAFRQVAVALAGYADDGQKARYVQELFGKSLKEVAPLLKDVAEAGKLNATVTTEQAKAAEAYNKEIFALQKNVLDLARAFSGPLISGINAAATELRNGFGLRDVPDSIAKVTSAYKLLSLARERITPLSILEKDPGNTQALAELARIDAEAKAILKTYTAAGDAVRKRAVEVAALRAAADAGNPANMDARDRRLKGAPSLPDLGGDASKAGEERAKALKEQWKQVFAFIDDQQAQEIEDSKTRNDQLEKNDKERTDAFKLQWQQVFQFIDDEQEQAIADGKAYLDSLAKDAKNSGEQIALALSSAASAAINNWQGVGNLIRGILKDLAQLALSETVLKPGQKAISEALSGFSWSSLFSGFRASGGPVEAGKAYVVGERRPELFVPRTSGTIIPKVGGMGALTYAPNIYVDSRTDQAQVTQLVGQMLAADKQALFEYMRAQVAM